MSAMQQFWKAGDLAIARRMLKGETGTNGHGLHLFRITDRYTPDDMREQQYLAYQNFIARLQEHGEISRNPDNRIVEQDDSYWLQIAPKDMEQLKTKLVPYFFSEQGRWR